MTTAFATKVIPDRVAERAALRYVEEVHVASLGPCHVSTYSTASHGYAQVGWKEADKNHGVTAQRAAWQYWNGPIPDGMTVDHKCRWRPCVRRDHLRLKTNADNASDNGQVRVNPDSGTFCYLGHPKTAAVGYQDYCRTCKAAGKRRVRAKPN